MVTAYALVVPFAAGEEARRVVASLGIGRADLKIGRREGRLLIPIREPFEPAVPGASVEVAEFEASRPPRGYKDFVQVPESLRAFLPSSFDIVGDLAILKVPRELVDHGPELGRAILEAHRNLRGVFHDDGVAGPLRRRTLAWLAGENRTRTLHKEHGRMFRVDLAQAYFSPRLANEHQRVAALLRPGEVFVDATAGVGPFAVLAAHRRIAKQIHAIDLNPAALALLRENLALNGILEGVEVHDGDARRLLPTLRPAHRVVINLPHDGEPLLEAAWRAIEPEGTIHYHAICRESEFPGFPTETAAKLRRATGRPGRVLEALIVHPYSPTDRMVAIDFAVGE